MYDIREELMHKMVRELRDQQSHFEIMSDEEFYNSDYGIRRRKNNQTCSKEIYMHCLVPGNAKNLLGVYFKRSLSVLPHQWILIILLRQSMLKKPRKMPFKKPYLKFKVERADLDDTYKDTVDLILGLLAFAKDNHLDQIW